MTVHNDGMVFTLNLKTQSSLIDLTPSNTQIIVFREFLYASYVEWS